MEPKAILTQLERELEALERSGVRWLSVGADPRQAPAEPRPAAAPLAPAPPGAAGIVAERPAPPVRPPPEAPTLAGLEPDADGFPHPSSLETIEALQRAYAACTRCKLCETRKTLVFGVGTARPRLMFVGEGPGADEDAQGEPFVGRAGALLTGLIRALGLVREDVYITNVVKCRPPGNRNPEPDEVASCRPILQRQIELLDPRLIVVLGNVPLKVLNPQAAGITRERGTPFTYQHWVVLPTFHPSYLLRNPAAIEACWQDFRKAVQLAYAQT
jgi:uracil-DNA glycosylase